MTAGALLLLLLPAQQKDETRVTEELFQPPYFAAPPSLRSARLFCHCSSPGGILYAAVQSPWA
eukprot:CAMPEP_0194293038 /NCGR_PEP_ID=MMETSP0169-20130528/47000_1 /TAXON_ID=218684 /ORGANISM="Corethron pennatum, Strain L29A3" /LENGTH=62 /DNA_ID=CAMNT_0039041407 /DNA_START=174 /DNA_END=359 /DNA_ORIENTATION=-